MSNQRTLIDPKTPFETAGCFLADNFSHLGCRTLWYKTGIWWLWDGTKYNEVHEEVITKKVYDWLVGCDHRIKVEKSYERVPYSPTPKVKSDVIDVLKSLCLLHQVDMPDFLTKEDWPEPKNIISFSNGLLDFEAMLKGDTSLIPHTPKWMSTNCLPFTFDETAKCPTWDWFINDVMSGDKEAVECLQKWFGLMLIADTKYQKIMLLTGTGRNGKGVLVRILLKLLGDGNYCTPTMKSCQNRFERANWMNKLAAIFPDAHMGRDSDAIEICQWLKLVSGEDRADIDRKNKDPITGVHIPARITITCNEVPRLPDAAKAIGARMLFVPFHRSYKGIEDLTLETRLSQELPGILLWALDGLQKLRSEGLSQPAVGASFAKDFNNASSQIDEFIEDCCEMGEGLHFPKDEFRRLLNIWLENRGYKPYCETTVLSKLKAVNSKIESGKARNGKGKREPIYKGIKVTQEAVNDLVHSLISSNVFIDQRKQWAA